MRPLRASSMIASAPTSTSADAALEQLFEPAERVGGRVPVGRAQLAQGIGVEAGGAGEAGAADFAGGDDGVEPLDQGGAHDRANITLQCDEKRNIAVPNVIWRPIMPLEIAGKDVDLDIELSPDCELAERRMLRGVRDDVDREIGAVASTSRTSLTVSDTPSR